MKSQKGVTLTSLVVYITITLIVVGILAVVTANFQSNVREIYADGTNNGEIDKFNLYFLQEVKKEGNEVNTISQNEVLFTTGNKYTFNSVDKAIYLNDNIKIAEKIEKCEFASTLINEKTVITVTIKAVIGEEKTIEYVIGNEIEIDINNEESDYINYIPKGWDLSKLDSENPVYIETSDNIYLAPIPKGFKISEIEDEQTISGGLVITDGENEFVWVPVENSETYVEDSFGPLEGTYTHNGKTIKLDTYQIIEYFYGTVLGTINSEESFNKVFTYTQDRENIQRSIRTYGGFYVGRYETTYDSLDTNGVPQKIGVKKDSYVLQTSSILQTGRINGENYYYRWWGLYKAQKDMYATNSNVGSIMISDNQWEAIMTFTGYGNIKRTIDTYTNTPDLSGSAYRTDTTKYDVTKNIYDLAGNLTEYTIRAYQTDRRVNRGGDYSTGYELASDIFYSTPLGNTGVGRFSCHALYKIIVIFNNHLNTM